jgi:hypothetical protein
MNAQTLALLIGSPRRSKREYTGIEGMNRRTVRKDGAHYTVTDEGPDLVTEREAWSGLMDRIWPFIHEWPPVNQAVLTLLLRGYTTREIMSDLRVGPTRVCSVRRQTKEFL